jgi:hypothetical protein
LGGYESVISHTGEPKFLGSLGSITSKLIPRRGNWTYLIGGALVTRVLIGFARIFQDRPSANPHPDLPKAEKYGTFEERIFVELFGTLGYMTAMQAGQGVVGSLLERMQTFSPKTLAHELQQAVQQKLPSLAHRTEHTLEQAVRQAFLPKSAPTNAATTAASQSLYEHGNHLFFNRIYESKNIPLTIRESLVKSLGKDAPPVIEAIEKPLNDYLLRSNVGNMMTILGGLLSSMVFGGFVVQHVNDHVFGNMLEPWLNRKLGIEDEPTASLNPPAISSPLPLAPTRTCALNLVSPSPTLAAHLHGLHRLSGTAPAPAWPTTTPAQLSSLPAVRLAPYPFPSV